MGNIWLQTSNGKLIHLPVIGLDINTPEDEEKIPTSIVLTQDRCLDQDMTIEHPTYGTITINFAPDNRTGSCNQCGQCCSHLASSCGGNCGYVTSGKFHACQYLTILPKGIGKPGGTECSLRSQILDRFKGCTLFPQTQDDLDSYVTDACDYGFVT